MVISFTKVVSSFSLPINGPRRGLRWDMLPDCDKMMVLFGPSWRAPVDQLAGLIRVYTGLLHQCTRLHLDIDVGCADDPVLLH